VSTNTNGSTVVPGTGGNAPTASNIGSFDWINGGHPLAGAPHSLPGYAATSYPAPGTNASMLGTFSGHPKDQHLYRPVPGVTGLTNPVGGMSATPFATALGQGGFNPYSSS
jgi:hypothetical protein